MGHTYTPEGHYGAESESARFALAVLAGTDTYPRGQAESSAEGLQIARDDLTPAGGVERYAYYRAMLSGGGPASWLHITVDADGDVEGVIWEGSHTGPSHYRPVWKDSPLWKQAEWIVARELDTCPRHGGPWGDDATCFECTDMHGRPVENPRQRGGAL